LGENGLLQVISENPIWQFVFPEISIFHGDDLTGLQALSGCPNISSTKKPELCKLRVQVWRCRFIRRCRDGIALCTALGACS
jgi:hypothetical protein